MIALTRCHLNGVAGVVVSRHDLFNDGVRGHAAGVGVAAVAQVKSHVMCGNPADAVVDLLREQLRSGGLRFQHIAEASNHVLSVRALPTKPVVDRPHSEWSGRRGFDRRRVITARHELAERVVS